MKLGKKVVVIDLYGNYEAITKECGGTIIDVKDVSLDPFILRSETLQKGDLKERVNRIFNYLNLLGASYYNCSNNRKNVVLNFIKSTYRNNGITEETNSIIGKDSPTIFDFGKEFTSPSNRENNTEAFEFYKNIEPYILGTYSKKFRLPNETPSVIGPVLNLSLKNVSDSESNIYASLILALDLIKEHYQDDALLVFDNFNPDFQSGLAKPLYDLFIHSKNKKIKFWIITESFTDFAIYCENLFLHIDDLVFFKQNGKTAQSISENIGLSKLNSQRLLKKRIGEGILIKNGLEIDFTIN